MITLTVVARGVLLVAAAVVGRALTPQEASDALRLYTTPTRGGKGSYYGDGLDEHGTCRLIHPLPTYASFRAIKMDVAMNVEQWFGSLACGMCLKVNHDVEGEFYTYVQDKCMGCGMGGLDLGILGHGKPKQTIQAVQCPVLNSKLQYKLEGDNFWLKVQVRNARVPIQKLSLKQKDGSWKDMKLENYGAFNGGVKLKSSGSDIHIKLKSVNGFEFTDVLSKVDFKKTETLTGTAQVPLDTTLPQMPGDSTSGGKVGPGSGSGSGGAGGGAEGTMGGKGSEGRGEKGSGSTNGGTGKTGNGMNKFKGITTCDGVADGTYGDSTDCKAFIQCAAGQLFRKTCTGALNFDMAIMNCNEASKAKCAA